MRKEEVQFVIVGGKVFVYFKTKLESISHQFGCCYSQLTDSSLQRIVNVMNSDLMTLELKKDGRFIYSVAVRKARPPTYNQSTYAEMVHRELPDPWG